MWEAWNLGFLGEPLLGSLSPQGLSCAGMGPELRYHLVCTKMHQEVLTQPLGVLPAAVTVGSSEGPSLSGSNTWALVGHSCSGKALLIHFGPSRPYLW